MNYSDLTDDERQKLIDMRLVNEDTVTNDFPLDDFQLKMIGGISSAPSESTDTSAMIPNKLDEIVPTQDIFQGIDANQSPDSAMRSDTIDYTSKIGAQRGIIQSAENERARQKQNDLMDQRSDLARLNLNTGDKQKDFENALQVQGIIDSDMFLDEVRVEARKKFQNRFGAGFDRIEPKKNEYGKTTGAKLIPKSLGRQTADAIFTTEAIDEGSILSGALQPFGIGSRFTGAVQNDGYMGSESTMYETDELKAIRQKNETITNTLEPAIAKLREKELAETDPAKKQKIRQTRLGLQQELTRATSPSGMEMVAEFGSASIDPLMLLDVGLMYNAGKGMYESAKAGTFLDDAKGLIKGARNVAMQSDEGADVLEGVGGVDGLFIDKAEYTPIEPTQTFRMDTENAGSVIADKPTGTEELDVDPFATFDAGGYDRYPQSRMPNERAEMPRMEMPPIELPTKPMMRLGDVESKGIPRPYTEGEQLAMDYPENQWIMGVNEYGKEQPRKMYHGGAEEIDAFDPSYSGMNTSNNPNEVMYHTDSEGVADEYRLGAIIQRSEPEEFADEFFEAIKNDPEELKKLDEAVFEYQSSVNDDVNSLDDITDEMRLEALEDTDLTSYTDDISRWWRGDGSNQNRGGNPNELEDTPEWFQNWISEKGSLNPAYIGGKREGYTNYFGESINDFDLRSNLENEIIPRAKQGYLDEELEYGESIGEWDEDLIDENINEIVELAYNNEGINTLDVAEDVFGDTESYEGAQEIINQVAEDIGIKLDSKNYPVDGTPADKSALYNEEVFRKLDEFVIENRISLEDYSIDQATDELLESMGEEKFYPDKKDYIHLEDTVDPLFGYNDERMDIGLIWDEQNRFPSGKARTPDAPTTSLFEVGQDPTKRKKPKTATPVVKEEFRSEFGLDKDDLWFHGTRSEFDEFSSGNTVENGSMFGKGNYFTRSKDDAEFWGSNASGSDPVTIKEANIDTDNFLDVSEFDGNESMGVIGTLPQDFKNFIADEYGHYYSDEFVDVLKGESDYLGDEIQSLRDFSDDLGDYAQEFGYDGILHSLNNEEHVVVFDPEKISTKGNKPSSTIFDAVNDPTRSRRKSRVSSVTSGEAPQNSLAELGQDPQKMRMATKNANAPKTQKEIYSPENRMQFARDKDGDMVNQVKEVQVHNGEYDEAGEPIYETRKYGRNPEISRSYDKYMDLAEEKYGVPRTDINVFARIDPERSRRIADEYQKMKHDPQNPVVKSAYAKMSEEMMDQYNTLIEDGWTFDFYPTNEKGDVIDPYGNPRNAIEDMRDNKHLYVYPTNDGFGTSDKFDPSENPLLAQSGMKFGEEDAMLNDIFRAVHDVFGHGMEEVGFRAQGEEHTWRSHARMFSPEARRALTTETRGQNSWLNFNPSTGAKNRVAKVEDTQFADQKTGLMPKWVSEEGLYDNQVIDRVNQLRTKKGKKPVKGKENPKEFRNEIDINASLDELRDGLENVNVESMKIDDVLDFGDAVRLKEKGYETIGEVFQSGDQASMNDVYKAVTGSNAPERKVYSSANQGSTSLGDLGLDPQKARMKKPESNLPVNVPNETPVTENPLAPVGGSIASLGRSVSNSDRTFANALGNLLQGIGVGVSELESQGLLGLRDAIRKGGYKAFVELPEQQKDLFKALIQDNSNYQKLIEELGAREGQIPKEFADEILEGFVRPKGGSSERALEKQSKMWKGTEARRLEEEALGDFKSEVPAQKIQSWVDEFIQPTGQDGSPLKFRSKGEEGIYQDLGRAELEKTLSQDAFKKMISYSSKGDMSYGEILDTIRAIDDGIDFSASNDSIRKVLQLRKDLNSMIQEATLKQIESGKFNDFFGEGSDTMQKYMEMRDQLASASELNDDFRNYAKIRGKTSGLSDYDVDVLADKVATAFGKITSKRGQTISELDNNTGFKLLKRIDKEQGTDFAPKVRTIMEIYTNPQVEVTKIKGGNKLGGYKLKPRAERDQWSQAGYFAKDGLVDKLQMGWNRFESALVDWSQKRSDLGATQQNKFLTDAVAEAVGFGVDPFKIRTKLRDAGVPSRQVGMILRPYLQDKGDSRKKSKSKDVKTKQDQEISFSSLSEVGRK